MRTLLPLLTMIFFISVKGVISRDYKRTIWTKQDGEGTVRKNFIPGLAALPLGRLHTDMWYSSKKVY